MLNPGTLVFWMGVRPSWSGLAWPGAFSRGRWRDAEWFKANVVSVYLGALHVPDGAGSRAAHRVGDDTVTITVLTPTAAPIDGAWMIRLAVDGVEQEQRSLAESLPAGDEILQNFEF